MSEYTPTADEVIDQYARYAGNVTERQEARREIRRWLAEHDRERDDRIEALEAERSGDVPDPCAMKHDPPMDFAYCETHDTTFPLGAACMWHGKTSIAQVLEDKAEEQRTRAVLAEARADRAEAQVARVKALHREAYGVFSWSKGGIQYEDPCPDCHGAAGVHPCGCWADQQIDYVCAECHRGGGKNVVADWPCPTIRALEGENDE